MVGVREQHLTERELSALCRTGGTLRPDAGSSARTLGGRGLGAFALLVRAGVRFERGQLVGRPGALVA
ncbi:hypothetical protein GCM10010430_51290 [Kitasatospora cystarginea]|uniref:Uncharacterized protein n=1 Tax=Kitasatospora cystarginea TaxID=58350 RepID=A0ABP5RFV1_9ACTN